MFHGSVFQMESDFSVMVYAAKVLSFIVSCRGVIMSDLLTDREQHLVMAPLIFSTGPGTH